MNPIEEDYYMKKISAVLLALCLAVFFTACKKTDIDKKTDAVATKYAKSKVSVYSAPTFDKNTWFSNLEKGEPVELISEETLKVKNKDTKVSKIKLSDDKIAYIISDYLAVKPIVFISKNAKVYNRNNINSGEYAIIPAGTVAFVTDEKADWLRVEVGKIGDKYIKDKWVKDGISDSQELVADAVTLEKIRGILTEAIAGNKEEALTLLRALSEKNNAIGTLAKEELLKYEENPADKNKQDQQPQNPPAAG
jgi:lipoprotein LenA